MEGLTIRRATAADWDVIAAIIDDPPSQQVVAIAGDERRARRAGRLFARAGISVQIENTVVAEIDGVAVGVMDAARGRRDVEPSPMLYAKLLIPAIRAVGPAGLWRYLRSRAAWDRVSFEHQATDYFIAELDVAAAYRNRGIGAALLRHGEQEARRQESRRMALTTTIDNPARRLYERSGFRVVETKTDASYERWGGSPGRVFMVRELDGDHASVTVSSTSATATEASP